MKEESKDLKDSLKKDSVNDFKFSQRSLTNLQNVDSELVSVAHLALNLSEVDFGISEGLRTLSRQKELVASGKSQTMNSKHLDNKSTPDVIDSWAIDTYAYVNGKVSWDIDHYITIAEAFRMAAIELNKKIRWGGSWTVLNNEDSAQDAYDKYLHRKRLANETPFVDGPHLEIIKD